nr:hypothetical protein [Tanacetum cinerariifolium]
EGVTTFVVDMTGEVEKQNSLNDNTVLEYFSPLTTPITIEASSAHSKSLYANVTVEFIRAISDRFDNTAYGDDGLSAIATKLCTPLMLDSYTADMCMQSCGRSSYARIMIELRADVELNDNGVVAIPRIKGATILVIFALSTLKKTSQTPKGILIGQRMRFKPNQVFQLVYKKYTANTRGKMNNPESTKEVNKKKGVEPTIEVSNSNPFDVLNSIDNGVKFGTNRGITNLINNGATSSGSSFMNVDNDGAFASNTLIGEKIDKIERKFCGGKLRPLNNEGNPLVPTGIMLMFAFLSM